MTQFIPSIFESFNARSLAPDQVAKTFIPPDHFFELIKRNHSVVIGPRGSGKTTLLKMLHPTALRGWDHPSANEVRGKIDFTGVFVPADITWGEQINALGKGKLGEEFLELFKNTAFATHILVSFVDSLRDRASSSIGEFRSLSLTKNDEAEIVRSLSDAWELDTTLHTFLGLRLTLKKRLIQISEIIKSEVLSPPEGRLERLQGYRYLFQDFLPLVSLGIDIVNDTIGEPTGKWGLLFDELEIAPRSIRRCLLSSLRSADQRIIFKLSLSPYNEDSNVLETTMSAMPGQDYSVIKLWYPRRDETFAFCHALFDKMLAERGVSVKDPESVLGSSPFDIKSNDGYRVGSVKHKAIKDLARNDASFNRYLVSTGVDIDKIDSLGESERASLIRKVISLVILRLEYRSVDTEEKQILRSRKNPRLYTGASSLFALVEGNPRWFIGIMGAMIQEYITSKSIVNRGKQSTEIFKTITRYRAMLKTISVSGSSQYSRGVLSLIDNVGNYFSQKVISDNFSPEPPLTFTVDSNVDQYLYDAVGKAVNAGAIVYIPDSEGEALLGSMKGKRFRVSYILAPHYKLPLTLGRSISLLSILKRQDDEVSQQSLL